MSPITGEFFAIFTIEKEVIKAKENPQPRVIALDPNHKNFAYSVGSDGRAIEILNLTHLRKLDERIDLLKSRRDNCQKRAKLIEQVREDGSVHRHWESSRRWQFFNQLLEKAYQERREQTKTFLYTLAHRLCRDYEIIGIGDYAPYGGGITTAMRRAMNNRSLIGRFKGVVAWVAVRAGRLFVEYEEKGTTRTCHLPDCGYQVEGGLNPTIREWICPRCQTLHIRDRERCPEWPDPNTREIEFALLGPYTCRSAGAVGLGGHA